MTLTAMDKSYASCYHSVSLPIRIMSYAVWNPRKFLKGKKLRKILFVFRDFFQKRTKRCAVAVQFHPEAAIAQAFGQSCEQSQRFSIYVLRNGYAYIQKFYRVL